MRSFRTFLWIALATALPASAQFYTIGTPTAQYTGGTTLLPVTVADNTIVNSMAGGGQTVTFSTPMQAKTVGVGWNTWGAPPNTESATPRVLWTDQLTMTFTLSSPALTFGFEVEPVNQCSPFPACATGPNPPTTPFTITATYFNGATVLGTVTRAIPNNGALLEAASSATPITSVTVTAQSGAGGFAIAQMRFGNTLLAPAVSSVPALGPGGMGALALLLAGAGSLLARRRALV